MNKAAITAWREKNKKSLEWLADSLGVSTATLSRYLSGRHNTPLSVIIATSHVTGISQSVLMGPSKAKAMAG
jgi:transcriptional regulator with XRE-family HTH domain